MRVSFNLGDIAIHLSSKGGVRIGGRIGSTYMSTQVVKPKKKKPPKKGDCIEFL
jgi:hypothetical protein